MADDPRILEAFTAVNTAYQDFISNLGDTRKLSDVIAAEQLRDFPDLGNILIPAKIELSGDQFRLSKERYKRTIAPLNHMVALLNSTVLTLEDTLLTHVEKLVKLYQTCHVYFCIISLVSKSQEHFVSNASDIIGLIDLETKIQNLKIPEELSLARSLSAASPSLMHKQQFKDLYDNFKENIVHHADTRLVLRTRISTQNSNLKQTKIVLIGDKYNLRLSDAFEQLAEIIVQTLATRYSSELRVPPSDTTALSQNLITICDMLKSWDAETNVSSSLSNLDLRSDHEKLLQTRSEIMKNHTKVCSDYKLELDEWLQNQGKVSTDENFVNESTNDYNQIILAGVHLAKRNRDYLARVVRILDNSIETHSENPLYSQLQDAHNNLEKITLQVEIVCKVEEERIKQLRVLYSDRLRSISTNSKARFAPIFDSSHEGFAQFLLNWREFAKDLKDERLLLLYLRNSVQHHHQASKLLQTINCYTTALEQLCSHYLRKTELGTLVTRRIYSLKQAHTVSDQLRLILELKIQLFKLERHDLKKTFTRTLCRFISSRFLERDYLKWLQVVKDENLDSVTDEELYTRFNSFLAVLKEDASQFLSDRKLSNLLSSNSTGDQQSHRHRVTQNNQQYNNGHTDNRTGKGKNKKKPFQKGKFGKNKKPFVKQQSNSDSPNWRNKWQKKQTYQNSATSSPDKKNTCHWCNSAEHGLWTCQLLRAQLQTSSNLPALVIGRSLCVTCLRPAGQHHECKTEYLTKSKSGEIWRNSTFCTQKCRYKSDKFPAKPLHFLLCKQHTQAPGAKVSPGAKQSNYSAGQTEKINVNQSVYSHSYILELSPDTVSIEAINYDCAVREMLAIEDDVFSSGQNTNSPCHYDANNEKHWTDRVTVFNSHKLREKLWQSLQSTNGSQGYHEDQGYHEGAGLSLIPPITSDTQLYNMSQELSTPVTGNLLPHCDMSTIASDSGTITPPLLATCSTSTTFPHTEQQITGNINKPFSTLNNIQEMLLDLDKYQPIGLRVYTRAGDKCKTLEIEYFNELELLDTQTKSVLTFTQVEQNSTYFRAHDLLIQRSTVWPSEPKWHEVVIPASRKIYLSQEIIISFTSLLSICRKEKQFYLMKALKDNCRVSLRNLVYCEDTKEYQDIYPMGMQWFKEREVKFLSHYLESLMDNLTFAHDKLHCDQETRLKLLNYKNWLHTFITGTYYNAVTPTPHEYLAIWTPDQLNLFYKNFMFHLKVMSSQDWCDDYDSNCTYPEADDDSHYDHNDDFHDYDDYGGQCSPDIFYSDDDEDDHMVTTDCLEYNNKKLCAIKEDDNDNGESNLSVGRVTNITINDAIDATDTPKRQLLSLKKIHECFQKQIQTGHIYAINDKDDNDSDDYNGSISTNDDNDGKKDSNDLIFDMESNDCDCNECNNQNNDCYSNFSCKTPVPEILPDYMTADFSFRKTINNYENHPLNLFRDCDEYFQTNQRDSIVVFGRSVRMYKFFIKQSPKKGRGKYYRILNEMIESHDTQSNPGNAIKCSCICVNCNGCTNTNENFNVLYQELLSPQIVEVNEAQYDQMVIDGSYCKCECKICDTKCEFFIQQFVARRARRREMVKLNIDTEENFETANIGSWSKKPQIDLSETTPYYYNNPYLPSYTVSSNSAMFQIDSYKTVKSMHGFNYNSLAEPILEELSEEQLFRLNGACLDQNTRVVEYLTIEKSGQLFYLSCLHDSGGQISSIHHSCRNISTKLINQPSRKISLTTESSTASIPVEKGKLKILTSNPTIKTFIECLSSGYSEPNKKHTQIIRMEVDEYFVSKYQVPRVQYLPRDPLVIIGSDLQSLAPIYLEQKNGFICYFSRLSHNIIVSQSADKKTVKCLPQIENFLYECGWAKFKTETSLTTKQRIANYLGLGLNEPDTKQQLISSASHREQEYYYQEAKCSPECDPT